jgi:CRP-like cAMP-binding protein
MSSSDTTLVVKKGMVFGIDGILLKDSEIHTGNEDGDNPEINLLGVPRVRSSRRVYTAKTIGRTEIYVLKRQILEGLFDSTDILSTHNFPR